jgi:signal transduction histidine kinase
MVFGLHAIARHLHQLEESRKLTTGDLHALENLFRDFLEKHQGILKTNWSPTGHHETRVSTAQLQQLEELIEKRQEAELTFAVNGWIQDVLAKPVGILVQPIVDNIKILAQRLNRQVDIQVTGSEVRVRSQQEEKAMEFLVHIMRNAIVHGMDEDRAAQGKSVQGRIHLEFSETRDTLRVTIRDDGRGFDRRYWEEKAREVTVKSDSAISRLSWVELIETVSRGGHSTQKLVSMEAGRGVGLEGVIQAVRDLGGHIHLETDSGRGSSIEIEIKRRLTHEAA